MNVVEGLFCDDGSEVTSMEECEEDIVETEVWQPPNYLVTKPAKRSRSHYRSGFEGRRKRTPEEEELAKQRGGN
jgi:hypothetical protein